MSTLSDALANALAHHRAGRLPEAKQIYRQILAANPNDPNAWHLLGVIACEFGNPEMAIECIGRALQLRPDSAEAHYNLARAFHEQQRLNDAIASYRRALTLKPDYAEAHSNLGLALQTQGMFDEAVSSYRRAAEFRPDHAETHYSLANALKEAGKTAESIASYRRALDLNPSHADALNNLGLALEQQGHLDEAVACYRRAAELKPDFVGAHWNLSLLLLLLGDFDHGWAEYEWRWKTGKIPARNFPQPRWQGENLAGKTILLHAEQGFGDTFQFIRYVPLVKNLGANVVVECQKALVKLLAGFPDVDQLVPGGQQLPAFDYHAPLMSLPGIFKTVLATIPATVPYLSADPALIAYWREKLDQVPGFRIGINWHGRVGDIHALPRHIQLEHFLPLGDLPGVRLISLQKSPIPIEPKVDRHAQFPIIDFGNELDQARGAFVDTAAIMMNLDLVISSDTSVVHLAGALGVPVWVALPSPPDWRWLLDCADSRWYPTLRLFRQKTPGDWSPVFDQIKHALAARLKP
jgi:tetratricopeptide (TPR) repeat protein